MHKVDVIIPTYNNARYIREAIDSVLDQSVSCFDILVVDDGSTDDTRSIVNSYKNQVRYIYQENQGLAVARNTGIAQTKNPFFTFLDGDDLWEPENLEIKLDIITKDSSIGAVFSNFTLFNDKGTITTDGIQAQYPIFFRKRRTLESVFSEMDSYQTAKGNRAVLYHGNIHKALLFGNFINACSIIVRRECQEKVGLFRAELRTQQDYEFWLRFSQYYDFCYVEHPLVHYRRHSSQLTAHKNMPRIIETVIGILTPYYESILKGDDHELKSQFSDRLSTSYINLGLAHLGNQNNRQARHAFYKAFRIARWGLNWIPYYVLACLPVPITKRFNEYVKR